jgi:hypothetical protein
MLAYRLAFQWGIVDVKKWLSSLPRGALDGWEAFDAVEPIGEHWRQTAQLTTIVTRLIEQNKVYNGFEVAEPATIDGNMPARYRREKTKKQVTAKSTKPAEPNAQFHQLAASFGLSQVVLAHGRSD